MQVQIVQNIEDWLPAIYDLNQMVFQESIEEKIYSKLQNCTNRLLLTAGRLDHFLGYKLGYQWDENTFYSWLGAVSPAARRKGLGRQMMEQQHTWCSVQGYSKVRTKTLDRWENMLSLNLALGFDIVSSYVDKHQKNKIVLEKILN